ncbi:MAG: hypothetical protein AAFY84_18575, partial [Pseudomonadota bacterium]
MPVRDRREARPRGARAQGEGPQPLPRAYQGHGREVVAAENEEYRGALAHPSTPKGLAMPVRDR